MIQFNLMINPEFAQTNYKELEGIVKRVDELRYKVERRLKESVNIDTSKQASSALLKEISTLSAELHECNRTLQRDTTGSSTSSMQS